MWTQGILPSSLSQRIYIYIVWPLLLWINYFDWLGIWYSHNGHVGISQVYLSMPKKKKFLKLLCHYKNIILSYYGVNWHFCGDNITYAAWNLGIKYGSMGHIIDYEC